MPKPSHPLLYILGGGPAGLGAAWFAAQEGLPFQLYEGTAHLGGNCRTLRTEEFLYDTGAHRLHDKDPEITELIKTLLGKELLRVDAPSAILHNDRFVDFPLHLSGLLRSLSTTELIKIAFSFFGARITSVGRSTSSKEQATFEELTYSRYGRGLSEMFLLNYSEKLWGRRPAQLSPTVSGGRLKGLSLRSFLRNSLLGKDNTRENLDGRFYYPKFGIGMIADGLAHGIGSENIQLTSRITSLKHNGSRITELVVNNSHSLHIPKDSKSHVVSTLPLTILLRSLNPPPPTEILEHANQLSFRHLLLLVFGLRRERLSQNASIYIPDATVPFTRLYESKNRSVHMAPVNKTSVVLELPCSNEDQQWKATPEELQRLGERFLHEKFAVKDNEIAVFDLHRIPFAYPVLETGFEHVSQEIINYLQRFTNLHLTGRSALFRYTHIHDLLRAGKETIQRITLAV